MTIMLPNMPVNYGMPMPQMQYGAMPMQMQQPIYFSSMAQLPPGAVPVSQGMLAQALGQSQIGGQMVQPEQPSKIGTILKGAGIGAAAGAAFGVIPFLPLGLFSGALVGAGVGAAIGLVTSLRSKPESEGEFHTMTPEQQQAIAQAQMAASTPPGARSVADTAPATPAPAPAAVKHKKVVMSPEMSKRWTAKQEAIKAAAAARRAPV
jgi:hypothetical protein